MSEYRKGTHSVSRLTVHVVWVTKYRYHVLKGVVSKDHIHIHIEYPPSLSVSELIKKMKGRTSRLLQQEFPKLGKKYWGRHFWAVGYGAWSTGNITDEMVQEYLEHHRDKPNTQIGNWILK